MSILDNLLGGNGDQQSEDYSNSQNDFDSVIGTNPAFGFAASDILHSESSDEDNGDSGDSSHDSFTGIGDVAFGFSAPTVVGVHSSNSNESWSSNESDDQGGGGLLGGLL